MKSQSHIWPFFRSYYLIKTKQNKKKKSQYIAMYLECMFLLIKKLKKKKKNLNWTRGTKLDNNWNPIQNLIKFSLILAIYIYIYMYVCMYLCMYVCMYCKIPSVYLKLHVVNESTIPYMALFQEPLSHQKNYLIKKI